MHNKFQKTEEGNQMEDLKITKIGEDHGGDIFEVEVQQGDGTTYAYTVSERSLNWLKDNNKSKWEVKYVSSSIREV